MEDGRWIANLANSICGVSLLALPYCFSQCGVVLGSILLFSSGLLTIWSTHLLIDCIFITKSLSCEGIAHKILGSYGKISLELISIMLSLGTCAAFFVIIADLAPNVFSWVTSVPLSTPYLRTVILLSLAVSIVFPLSLLRQLDTLSGVSTVSLFFYIWLTVQLIVYGLQKINVSFDHIDYWKSSGMFHAVPIYALAFACHLQLVAIIKELLSGEVHEGDTQNGPRAKVISKWSVIIVGTVYGSVALFGHIAFVTSGVNGDILSNFDDGLLAQSTRIGFTLSVIVSFPFMVNPCRAVVHSFMYGKIDHIPGSRHLYITLLIITISFIVAVCTPNVELVLSITGAVCGATLCYLFPALSYLYLTRGNTEYKDKWKALVVLCVGVFLLIGGTLSSLTSSSHSPEDTVIQKLSVNEQPQIHDKIQPLPVDDKDGLNKEQYGTPVDKDLTKIDTNKLLGLSKDTISKGEIAGRVLNSNEDAGRNSNEVVNSKETNFNVDPSGNMKEKRNSDDKMTDENSIIKDNKEKVKDRVFVGNTPSPMAIDELPQATSLPSSPLP